MDMRRHEVALDGTCGQSGTEIHAKEPKTVYKFLLFITYPCTAGGVRPSPLAQWPITDLLHHLQMGWCDNYDCLST